jgi:hypothetical protein
VERGDLQADQGRALPPSTDGLPEQTIQHLSAVAFDFREEMFVGADDVIETINDGGRAQESLVFCVCPRATRHLLISCAPHKK